MSFVVIPADTAFTGDPVAFGPFEHVADALDHRDLLHAGPGENGDWTVAPLREPEILPEGDDA